MITVILVFLVTSILWLAYEVWRAPLLDDNYKVIRPTKTLKSLFRIKKQ